jgi:hypothetical protein
MSIFVDSFFSCSAIFTSSCLMPVWWRWRRLFLTSGSLGVFNLSCQAFSRVSLSSSFGSGDFTGSVVASGGDDTSLFSVLRL